VWATAGGGTGDDNAEGVAVSGTNLYLTGAFRSSNAARFAGVTFAGAGGDDVYLAKYLDNGSTVANGWAVRGGGPDDDSALGVSVSGSSLYITGGFRGSAASFAGTTLASTGSTDLFIAAYTDAGSSATNAWANSGGGTSSDDGTGVAAGPGGSVYVTGSIMPPASFGGLTVATPVDKFVDFLGRLGAESVAITSLSPAHGVAGTAVTLSGSGLGSTASVNFNGTAAASFTVNSPMSVTVVVPVGTPPPPAAPPSATLPSAATPRPAYRPPPTT
jgi:hypothetical protein